MMANSTQYGKILKEYPEHITKEQLYKICHVSKHTARYYLESGLIPSTSSGKKTRKYKVATKDVVAFLKKRDKNPKRYLAPDGWYQGMNGYKAKPKFIFHRLEQTEKAEMQLTRWLAEYPDLIKPPEVSRITGYSKSAVVDWCAEGKLHHFLIRRTYFIPKLSLIDFMLSEQFNGFKIKPDAYEDFVAAFNKT